MPTDTERLDWLIGKNGGEWYEPWISTVPGFPSNKGYWFQIACGERSAITPEADEPREAIDLAIAKEASDQAYLHEAIDYSRSLQP
jgi:hypothetical protein